MRQARKSSGTRIGLPELAPAAENVVIGRELMIQSGAKLILADNRLRDVLSVPRRRRRRGSVRSRENGIGIRSHVRVEHVRGNLVALCPDRSLIPVRVRQWVTTRVAEKGSTWRAAERVKYLLRKGHAPNRCQIAAQFG